MPLQHPRPDTLAEYLAERRERGFFRPPDPAPKPAPPIQSQLQDYQRRREAVLSPSYLAAERAGQADAWRRGEQIQPTQPTQLTQPPADPFQQPRETPQEQPQPVTRETPPDPFTPARTDVADDWQHRGELIGEIAAGMDGVDVSSLQQAPTEELESTAGWVREQQMPEAETPAESQTTFERVEQFLTEDTYAGQQALSMATMVIDFVPAALRGARSNVQNTMEAVFGEKATGAFRRIANATPLALIAGDNKDLDRILDASGDLRKEARRQLMEAAFEQGGMVGAGAAALTEGVMETLLTLKTFQVLKIGYGQEAIRNVGRIGKSWGVVKNALLRSGLMTATREHESLQDMAKSFGISLAYQSTPALSRHFNNNVAVIAADIGLNFGISATQVSSIVEAGHAQAEAESAQSGDMSGLERRKAMYATVGLVQAFGSDVVFGAMSRSFRNTPPAIQRKMQAEIRKAERVSKDVPDKPVPETESERQANAEAQAMFSQREAERARQTDETRMFAEREAEQALVKPTEPKPEPRPVTPEPAPRTTPEAEAVKAEPAKVADEPVRQARFRELTGDTPGDVLKARYLDRLGHELPKSLEGWNVRQEKDGTWSVYGSDDFKEVSGEKTRDDAILAAAPILSVQDPKNLPAMLRKGPNMEAKQAALDKWKTENPEAVREIEKADPSALTLTPEGRLAGLDAAVPPKPDPVPAEAVRAEPAKTPPAKPAPAPRTEPDAKPPVTDAPTKRLRTPKAGETRQTGVHTPPPSRDLPDTHPGKTPAIEFIKEQGGMYSRSQWQQRTGTGAKANEWDGAITKKEDPGSWRFSPDIYKQGSGNSPAQIAERMQEAGLLPRDVEGSQLVERMWDTLRAEMQGRNQFDREWRDGTFKEGEAQRQEDEFLQDRAEAEADRNVDAIKRADTPAGREEVQPFDLPEGSLVLRGGEWYRVERGVDQDGEYARLIDGDPNPPKHYLFDGTDVAKGEAGVIRPGDFEYDRALEDYRTQEADRPADDRPALELERETPEQIAAREAAAKAKADAEAKRKAAEARAEAKRKKEDAALRDELEQPDLLDVPGETPKLFAGPSAQARAAAKPAPAAQVIRGADKPLEEMSVDELSGVERSLRRAISTTELDSPAGQKLLGELTKVAKAIDVASRTSDDLPPGVGAAAAAGRMSEEGREFWGAEEAGIRHAYTEAQREIRGMEPRTPQEVRHDKDIDAEIQSRYERDPQTGAKVIDRFEKDAEKVPTDRETAILLRETVKAEMEVNEASERDVILQSAAVRDTKAIAENQERLEAAHNTLDKIYSIAERAGSEAGRALRARQFMMDSDFNLHRMEHKVRKSQKDIPLTKEQRTEIERIKKQYDSDKKRMEAEIERLRQQTDTDDTPARTVAETEFKKLVNRAARKGPPQMSDLDAADREPGTDIKSLYRQQVEAGVRDLDQATRNVTEIVKETRPDATEQDIRDEFSDYGKTQQPSQDVVDQVMTDFRRQAQLYASIERLQRRVVALKTGRQRDPASPKVRELERQLHDLEKQAGISRTDPARERATALDTVKNRLRNSIEDLDKAIKTHTEIKREQRGITYDDEARALQTQRDQLKVEYQRVFPAKPLTEQQRLHRAIKTAENNLKRWEKRLAEAREGQFPRHEPQALPPSERLDFLHAQRNAAKAEIDRLQEAMFPGRKALEQRKKQLAASRREFQRRIDEQDFAPRARTDVDISRDPEALEMQRQLTETKIQYLRMKEDARKAARTTAQVFWEGGLGGYDFARRVISSYDFSALLRQGRKTALSNPREWWKAVSPTFKAYSRNASQAQWERDKHRTNFKLYGKAKLRIVEGDGTGNFSGRIDDVLESPISDKIPHIQRSYRAYATALNQLRMNLFDRLLENQPDRESMSSERLKELGSFVNYWTGSGDLGTFDPKTMSRVFWAPRFMKSQLDTITGPAKYGLPTSFTGISPEMRRTALAAYARGLSSLAAIYGAHAAFNYLTDEEYSESVEWNPTSSLVGGIKIGNFYINPINETRPLLTLLARMIGGEIKTASGQRYVLTKGYHPFTSLEARRGDEDAIDRIEFGLPPWTDGMDDLAQDFLRGKRHPTLNALFQLYQGTDFVGKPQHRLETLVRTPIPIVPRTIYDMFKTEDPGALVALSIAAVLGVGPRADFDSPAINKARMSESEWKQHVGRIVYRSVSETGTSYDRERAKKYMQALGPDEDGWEYVSYYLVKNSIERDRSTIRRYNRQQRDRQRTE